MSNLLQFLPSAKSSFWLTPSKSNFVPVHHQDAATGRTYIQLEHSVLGCELSSHTDSAKRRMAQFFAEVATKRGLNVDPKVAQDAATNFVTNQLTAVLGPSERVIRGNNRQWMFVPGRVSNDRMVLTSRDVLQPGHRDFSYQVRQYTGRAGWTTLNATRKLQAGGAVDDEVTRGPQWYGACWEYNQGDLWRDAVTGQNTPDDNQTGCILSMDEFRETSSMLGAPEMGVFGLATLPDAIKVGGGTRLITAGLTAPQLYARVLTWINFYMRCNNNALPSGVVAPMMDKQTLQTTIWDNSGGKSVWASLLELHPWLDSGSFWDDRMMDASPTSTPRWIFFQKDDQNAFIAHTERMVFGPFLDEMTTRFVVLARQGGVVDKLPEQFVYIDFN